MHPGLDLAPVGGGQSPAGPGPPLPPHPWHQPPQVHASSNQALLGSGALAPDHPLQGRFPWTPRFPSKGVTVQGGSTEGGPRDKRGERQVREGPAAGSGPSRPHPAPLATQAQ